MPHILTDFQSEAYNKEDCVHDPGWCFKAAVGNSLPNTFFSYGQAQAKNPTQTQALSVVVGAMALPPICDVLTRANQHPAPLSSLPAQASEAAVPGEAPTSTAPWTPPPAYNTDSPPSVPNHRKRESMSMSRHRHRLASLHHRRQSPSSSSSSSNGTLFDYDGYAMTMDQIAIVKGYSDGFMTAKLFATYDMSRLGFASQYINDSMKALGPDVIEVGTEHCYTEWFMNGLQDGQAVVFGAVGAQNNV